MTLEEFVLARLTEDEAGALQASDGGDEGAASWGVYWSGYEGFHEVHTSAGESIVTAARLAIGGRGDLVVPTEEQAAHMAIHDPARVLAEVAVKRRIVHLHRELLGGTVGAGTPPGRRSVCPTCSGTAPCETLRVLGALNTGHAEYDKGAWQPNGS